MICLNRNVLLYGASFLNFPKLKNALLCRILIYVVILGGVIVPAFIVGNLKFVPEGVKIVVGIGLMIGALIYLIKNFVLLLTMDAGLAVLQCHNTARKRFVLPLSFSVQGVERKLSHFGEGCEPRAISPRPATLRYKSNAPVQIYSSGIEKVVATYGIDYLDKDQYHLIVNSALANAKALKGRKKHHFLDRSQKSAPLNTVTVIVIYAKRVDENFRKSLFKAVCQNGGDGFDTAVLPCVVDLETHVATFDSLRIPYMGFQYPVKNRGIAMIRKYVFRNAFPFADSTDMCEPIEGIDPEQSLWSFWRTTKKDLRTDEKKMKKCFESMGHREVVFEDGYVYLKWKERGVWLSAEADEERRTVTIDTVDSWEYPKTHKIAKDTVTEIREELDAYFAVRGYTTRYV